VKVKKLEKMVKNVKVENNMLNQDFDLDIIFLVFFLHPLSVFNLFNICNKIFDQS
jgi:hypothetical protein